MSTKPVRRRADSSFMEKMDDKSMIQYGRVISIDDNADAMRIRVRVKGIDDKFKNEEVPYCYPFLPKFFSVLPKVGEMVKVIFLTKNERLNREWIGPVISQPQRLDKDSFISTAWSMTDKPKTDFLTAISNIPEAEKVYPEIEDISVQGRKNTDIILKDREALIRVGKHVYNNNVKLNKTNPAYIQLKMFNNDNRKSTHTNIVSDHINLISHKNEDPKINPVVGILGDTEKQIFAMEERLSPLVKGDKLIDFLKLLQQYVAGHIHNGSRIPADNSGAKPEILRFDLDSLLSKNIRVN